jgi:hypothetical protein
VSEQEQKIVPVHTRLVPSNSASIAKVRQLTKVLQELPQTPFVTEHLLHAGMYTRTVRFPAGTVLTAVLIKVGTVFIICGSADIYSNDELIPVEGFTILPGSAGRKVAIVTHSEVAISMILTTTATTIEEAEKAFTDEYSLLVPLSETDKHRILITGE